MTNIFIAEDETIIALDISNTLQRLGYNVMGVASSGAEIFQQLEKSIPDLIMMDIMLDGDMSGIEAANIISQKYSLPVVFLTALTDQETLQRAKTTNPFGYILKPYDEKSLHSAIEMALYKHKVEGELQAKTIELEEEKRRADDLLKNILPAEIVEEIKLEGSVKPRFYNEVSILFTEFCGFDQITSETEPALLLQELNEVFEKFDSIVQRHNLEKMKTIGDSYMIASGVPNSVKDHAEKLVQAAIEMRDYILNRNIEKEIKLEMMTGIHTGPVVAGIVGMRKFTYDVWGDTVNIASRMTSGCEPQKINISGATHSLINNKFNCEYRGKLNAKGKGEIDMYFVESSK
ncbi:MAG TPA: adenylate/guanylate cyclase domain-containing protein [Ignavibacteriaceae bacterium]|nr:adenylate/guanylate cyclase domain-containing protein [Ignavibacteriaceae bacterium]